MEDKGKSMRITPDPPGLTYVDIYEYHVPPRKPYRIVRDHAYFMITNGASDRVADGFVTGGITSNEAILPILDLCNVKFN